MLSHPLDLACSPRRTHRVEEERNAVIDLVEKSESVSVTGREKGVWEPRRAADGREERRKRAWERKQAGWSQNEIAEALGVTEGAG